MQIPGREELMQFESSRVGDGGDIPQIEASIRAVQSGASAVNVAVEMRSGAVLTRELALVTLRDGKWGIAAASAMQSKSE